jgi:peptide deformylase
MILPIRAYGDPILHKQAMPVSENSDDIQELIDNMLHTMRNADGAGLAAPQIGKSLRIFVADLSGARSSLPESERRKIPRQTIVCINPKIVFESQEKAEFEEGCLSIPNLPVKIERPNEIKLLCLDRNFKQHEIEARGIIASILQHENDHLNGVLHIDYLSRFRKKLIENRLNQIVNGNFESGYPMQIGD